jgi:hypothetical protein
VSEALDYFAAKVRRMEPLTWSGTCMVTVTRALRDLPSADARLILCRDLARFIQRQADEIDRGLRRRQNHGVSKASRPQLLK